MGRILALATAALALVTSTALAGPSLPLGHAGRWLTDSRGRAIVLHGLNEVYKFPPYAPAAQGFGDDDAAFLAAQGFNAVRVGVIYKAVEPQPGVYDDAYLDAIAATVAALGRHGITAMLDFHQDLYNERFQGEGFPDWAVIDDGLPNPPLGFPANYLGNSALDRALDHFWNNDPGPGGVGLQDRFAAAWHHVAARFAGDHSVLGYEILNEPFPGTLWEPCAVPSGCPGFDAELAAMIRRVSSAIRSADPHRLIWFEPNVLFNFGVDTQLPVFNDPHLGFAFHDYCLVASAVNVNAGCDPFDDSVLTHAAAYQQRAGTAILLTEFGATAAADILGPMLTRSDAAMVGWLEWAYTGGDPTSSAGSGNAQAIVFDPNKAPSGSNVDNAKLALLARPYPQVVSGTPQAWSFDGSTFSFRYSTRSASGRRTFPAYSDTEIAIPAAQYPSGYALQVQGGTILSNPRAAPARIGSCPGADTVTVTLTRSGTPSETCTRPPVSGAAVPGPLNVTIRPHAVRAGKLVHIRVAVRQRGVAVAGAIVRLGRRRVRTGRNGRARLSVRFGRPGVHYIAVSARGARPVYASVLVLAR